MEGAVDRSGGRSRFALFTGFESLSLNIEDFLTEFNMQLKRLNVARVLGVLLCFCMFAGEFLEADTIYHLRFEDDSPTEVFDSISGFAVGLLEEPTTLCDDTPGPTREDAINNFALDSQRGRGALVFGEQLPFIFHESQGDATLEWYAKVPSGQAHSSMFWTNDGNSGSSGTFNIFWEAGFAGVTQTVAGDVGGPNPIAGTPSGSADWATLPDSVLFPVEEWFHVAIVRTDMDGAGGSRFTWDWFLNGEPLTGHSGSVSFAAMPALANNWLIARRTATTCCDFRGFMDEIRGSDVALESEDFLYFGPLSPPGGSCKPDVSDLTIRDAWYRFEEGAGNDIRNAFDNAIEGNFTGGQYSEDTVGTITDGLSGETFDNHFSYQNNTVGDLCTITKTSFVLHKPDGDATFECFVKVRSPNPGHQSIVWSNPGDENNRFNIFWNAAFAGSPNSDRFVSGDFNTESVTTAIAPEGHDVGSPQPLDQWFHMAIVRTDNGDTSFDWDWYFNGARSPGHSTTTAPGLQLPTAANILIAGRNFSGHRLMVDEFRMLQQALTPGEFLGSENLQPDFRAEDEFTTTENPNGAWSYRDSDGNLITNVVPNWQSGDLGGGHAAYAASESASSGWASSTGGSELDLPEDSLFTRGQSQLWWTAQEVGNVSISGGVWIASDVGPSGTVDLLFNDIETVFSSIAVTAAGSNSNDLVGWEEGDGEGEATVFGVQPGDVLKISVDVDNYLGLSLVVFSTPVTTPRSPPIEKPVPRIYDLAGDFSDENNPNGAWSYRNGIGALIETHVEEWLNGDLGLEQPAWAVSTMFTPGWALSNGASFVGPHPEYDWPIDTVMSHGRSIARWRAPGDGNVTISGGVWLLRNFGRDQSVRIVYNGAVFAAGSLLSGDAGPEGLVNSSAPLAFEDFGKAGGALSFGVRYRDEIDFTALPLSGVDDFVAYDVEIDYKPGDPLSEGPVVLTNPPQPPLAVERVTLDSEPSADVYTLAVGDFNGDTKFETAWGFKQGGSEPNTVRVVYANETPFGLSVSAIEEVLSFGPNEGVWLVRAGDFLGLGRDQLLVAGNWQFSTDDFRFLLLERTTEPAGTDESWSLLASIQTRLASLGYSAVADLFGDGTESVVLGTGVVESSFSRVLCFDVDVPTFIDVHDAGTGHRMTGTFIGDISGDGVLDVGYFFTFGPANEIGFKSLEEDSTCTNASFSETGFLYGNTAPTAPFDGSTPSISDTDVGMGLRLPPPRGEGGSIVVGDPSRDGRNEVVVPLGGAFDGYLVSWQADAATHGGLPADIVSEFEVIDIRRGVTFTAVALGDVNADGALDIVAGTSDAEIFMYTRTSAGYSPGNTLPATLVGNDGGGAGEPLAGNAYQRCNLSNFDNSNLGAITGIEIADVDNDNKLEIAFTTDFGLNYGRNPGPNGVHLINDLEGVCTVDVVPVGEFRRGDCDQSGQLDFNDAIFHLKFLFLGENDDVVNSCRDACDSDDSGADDFTDDINSLRFLFLGQGEILAPGPLPDESHPCGSDPTGGDDATCESYSPDVACP